MRMIQKCTLSLSWNMYRRLQEEQQRRYLESIPAVVRSILAEYFATHPSIEETTPTKS